jgi:cystathionine beta-lyase
MLHVPDRAALEGRRGQKWADEAPGVIASTVAEMDFAVAEPIAAALHAAVDQGDLGYMPADTTRLADALAAFARRRLGWTVDPARVTPVPDVMVGIVELARLIGGGIAFTTPAYPPFFLELSPHRTVTGLDELRTAFRDGVRTLVLSNPHNPTGRVPGREELAAIADVAAEHDAWVLADEIHAPLTLAGATHTPFLEVSDAAREHGIALTSASKAFNLAALKCAFAVTASARGQALVDRLGPGLRDHVGLLGAIAAEVAFTDGDPWLDALLAQLDANRALLADRLPAPVRWTPPEATYLAWLDLSELGLGDDPAAELRRRAGVALSPGHTYGAPSHARLNFGTSAELVAETADRIAAAL